MECGWHRWWIVPEDASYVFTLLPRTLTLQVGRTESAPHAAMPPMCPGLVVHCCAFLYRPHSLFFVLMDELMLP